MAQPNNNSKNNKATFVRCTECANSLPPVVNYLMGCKLSRHKVHTGRRVCPNFIPLIT